MNNAELIVRLLEQAGVRWVFGVPSGPVLPLIEALRESDVDYVLTASETSAGFMAATVGQLTGAPGVCVSTVGPGATNLATGVGAGWLDGAPMLAITCNVPTAWLDRRIQMRIDHHALFQPLTKATIPLRAANVAQAMHDAIVIAREEVPGPVHLDLPEDVATATAVDAAATPRAPRPLSPIVDDAVTAVEAALRTARRPIVLTGLAIARSQAADALRTFVERQNLPLISTLHGKGVFPESHPNWCGVLGRARRSDVQAFVRQADVVIAIGYDPIEINYEEWVGSIPVVHISTEAADAGDTVAMRANLGGAMDDALWALARLDPIANDWTPEELARQRAELDTALRPANGTFAAHQVLDALRARLPTDGILAYDVGAHTHQIATQWRTDLPGTCLATNGWSSMGFGMPAAYAAKLVHPDRVVVGVVGDGCFQMTAGELALARRLNLRVPIVVLNDGWLGLMKVKQERKGYRLSGVYLGEPVPPPAHYFGVPCRGARTLDELENAIDWALALDGPSVVEAMIDVDSYSATVFD